MKNPKKSIKRKRKQKKVKASFSSSIMLVCYQTLYSSSKVFIYRHLHVATTLLHIHTYMYTRIHLPENVLQHTCARSFYIFAVYKSCYFPWEGIRFVHFNIRGGRVSGVGQKTQMSFSSVCFCFCAFHV